MSTNRTASMLQRVPVILAVTAGSYGLPLQDGTSRKLARALQGGHAGRHPTANRRKARATS